MNNFASGKRFETMVARRLRRQGYEVNRFDFWNKAFDMSYIDEEQRTCYVSCKRNGRLSVTDRLLLDNFKDRHPDIPVIVATEPSPNNVMFMEYIVNRPTQAPPSSGEEQEPPS